MEAGQEKLRAAQLTTGMESHEYIEAVKTCKSRGMDPAFWPQDLDFILNELLLLPFSKKDLSRRHGETYG
jgi:hypothetical protein